MPIRTATARWEGNLTEGSGTVKTGKGGYQGNYSFKSRFEEVEGTNPEELIAAAHSGCFSMAFSKGLADAGFTPTSVETVAKVHLDKTDAGFGVSRIDLRSEEHTSELQSRQYIVCRLLLEKIIPLVRLPNAPEQQT